MKIMDLIQEYGDKQASLTRLRESETLQGIPHSLLHFLDAIAKSENANNTWLAQKLRMTKGAVSKNVKKLLQMGLIEEYQQQGNIQKIFYRLSEQGKKVQREHARIHQEWLDKDSEFLASFPSDQTEIIENFFCLYIGHIDRLIREKEERTEK